MRRLLLLALFTGLLSAEAASAASQGMLETEPGVRIFWRMIGSGEETVIVPGGFLFDGAMDFLAENRRVVLYDMRNRGQSSRVTDPSLLTIDADVKDLEALRRHIGTGTFSTIGYSYLGKMVVLYALEHPGRVERIVQIGPVGMRFGALMPPTLDNTAEDVIDPEALAEVRELRSRGVHESNPREYCEREWLVTRVRLVGDPSKAGKLKSPCHMENEWPVNLAFHIQHHFASAREATVDPVQFRGVRAPVLTVHGTLDRNAPYGGGREWAALLAEARLVTIEGGAHQAWVDDPSVLGEIRKFFDGSWPSRAENPAIASEVWLSQLRGWELLDRARTNASKQGTVRSDSSPMRIVFSGTLYPREQSERPVAPFTAFPLTEDVVLDPASGNLAVQHEMRWPNFTSRVRMVAMGERGFEVSGSSSRAMPLYISPAELRLRYIRRLPPILIDEALRQPSSIRFLGMRAEGEKHFSLVSTEVEGSTLVLWLDRNDRLHRVARVIPDALIGDVVEETTYSDADGEAASSLPRSVKIFFNGRLSADLTIDTHGTVTEEDMRDRFELPAGGMAAEPEESPLEMRQLAERVWLVTNIGGRDYRSLVIEHDDGLVLGETPIDRQSMESVLELLAGRFPGKPVRTAVVTHHHFDHSGGVTAVMRAGAKIVTAPGNAAFFRAIANAPRTIEGGPGLPFVELDLVRGDRKVLDGSGPAVEVHRIEAEGHAAEMLFLWLPDERILFQGDLYVHIPDSPEPARRQAVSLLKSIEERSLPVERIVGVHGEIATIDELRAAVFPISFVTRHPDPIHASEQVVSHQGHPYGGDPGRTFEKKVSLKEARTGARRH